MKSIVRVPLLTHGESEVRDDIGSAKGLARLSVGGGDFGGSTAKIDGIFCSFEGRNFLSEESCHDTR